MSSPVDPGQPSTLHPQAVLQPRPNPQPASSHQGPRVRLLWLVTWDEIPTCRGTQEVAAGGWAGSQRPPAPHLHVPPCGPDQPPGRALPTTSSRSCFQAPWLGQGQGPRGAGFPERPAQRSAAARARGPSWSAWARPVQPPTATPADLSGVPRAGSRPPGGEGPQPSPPCPGLQQLREGQAEPSRASPDGEDRTGTSPLQAGAAATLSPTFPLLRPRGTRLLLHGGRDVLEGLPPVCLPGAPRTGHPLPARPSALGPRPQGTRRLAEVLPSLRAEPPQARDRCGRGLSRAASPRPDPIVPSLLGRWARLGGRLHSRCLVTCGGPRPGVFFRTGLLFPRSACLRRRLN